MDIYKKRASRTEDKALSSRDFVARKKIEFDIISV